MKRIVQNLILVLASALLTPSVDAASSGVTLDKAALRLLDGGIMQDGRYLAGVDITLSAGVKTYWRMPGDSGLPPIFDFSASKNLASVEVKWPAPLRITEADGTILGFKEHVVFPLIITAKNATEPVTLAVTLDFGLCDTLCLPARAELVSALTSAGGATAKADIGAFLAQVPQLNTLRGQAQPTLLSVTPEGAALSLQIASDSALKDVILEAPGSWYFGQPDIAPDGEGRYRVKLTIDQKPSSATLGGLALNVTAISEKGASETPVTLDASGSIR